MRSFFCDIHKRYEVLHMRDQITVGLGVADSFMQKRLLMVCSDKNKGNIFSGLMRRVLQDASNRLDATDINKLHHLGFVDLSKFGRLAAPEINDICTWCHQLLSQNPENSILLPNYVYVYIYINMCVCVFWLLGLCFCGADVNVRHGVHVLSNPGGWRCHEWTTRRAKEMG